jgi:hypothetical protein
VQLINSRILLKGEHQTLAFGNVTFRTPRGEPSYGTKSGVLSLRQRNIDSGVCKGSSSLGLLFAAKNTSHKLR